MQVTINFNDAMYQKYVDAVCLAFKFSDHKIQDPTLTEAKFFKKWLKQKARDIYIGVSSETASRTKTQEALAETNADGED